MKSFIWDLDGTLLDSYEVIVNSLQETLQAMAKLHFDSQMILDYVINYSVNEFISYVCKDNDLVFEEVKGLYSNISSKKQLCISPIEHAVDILEYLKSRGNENYVFTHKGKSTKEILTNLGMIDYFKEIITSQNGFPRKPAPDALNYLIDKYALKRSETYYVGDRNIDIACAQNANIHGILYLPGGTKLEKKGHADYLIKDLLDIKKIM